jgi:hypothetical protein
MSSVLAYVAAAGIALWGVAHAVPTGRVLAGFAPVTADSRRAVLQEWLAEAFTMRGLAAVVVAVTAAGGVSGAGVRDWVYRGGRGAADRAGGGDRADRRQDGGNGSRSARSCSRDQPACCLPLAPLGLFRPV